MNPDSTAADTQVLVERTADLFESIGTYLAGHLTILGGLVPTLLVPRPPFADTDAIGPRRYADSTAEDGAARHAHAAVRTFLDALHDSP